MRFKLSTRYGGMRMLSPEDIETGKMIFKMMAAVFFGLALAWLILNIAVDWFDD